MNLKEHYNKLYENSVKKIKSYNYEIDPLIDSVADKRNGVTLLFRPNFEVKNNIQLFLNDLMNIDSRQYYYSFPDIHLTVASIISCYDGFNIEDIEIHNYIDLINKSLHNIDSIKIEFRGITASPSCIMIQGFMTDNTLNDIRNNLRANFSESDLQQSIDKRYVLQTAHLTVVRFREQLLKTTEYLEIMEKYRDFNFGISEVENIEFVHNDWYMHANNVKMLHTFKLR
ncbi:MAG: hypothetical protein JEY94_18095 [Melioribacteraceae bacterium]|nr:hypothetical protein [Melioribacteraceae bacterium]